MDWIGLEWSGVVCNGVDWIGVVCSAVRSGVEWCVVEWCGAV